MQLKNFWPAYTWAGLILVVSSIPALSPPSIRIEIEDKVAHFGEYMVLGFLTARAFWGHNQQKSKTFLYTSGICTAFGIFDEIHQAIIPNRTTDVFDMLADMLGTVAGSVIAIWWYSRKSGKREKI